MKKVILCFVFLMFSMVSFGSAFQANVTIIDEIGSFTGAYLKIKSVDSSAYDEGKITPSEYHLINVGILKFNLEVGVSSLDIKVVLIKNGQSIQEFEVGPFSINGSDILIDRRDKVVVAEVIAEVVEEVNESSNDSADEEMVIIEEEIASNEESVGLFAGLVTGENGGIFSNWKYSLGGGLVLLLLVVFVVVMVVNRRKSKKVPMGEDEKELEYMEKKVKEVEGKIVKIKDGKEVKGKVVKAKAKLAQEEAELRELETGGNEKRIEQQEKVVDKAEDRVESVEDQK